MKLRDQDLDALRRGIAKQERERLTREDTQRRCEHIADREYVQTPELRPARDLRVGDRLLASDSGQDFYVSATVTYVGARTPDGKPTARDMWVEASDHSGRALSNDGLVLLVRRP